MASPQVCGVLACILQMRPNLTPAESRDLIMDLSQPARVFDSTGSTGNDYTDYKALQGAFNNFLQQRFKIPTQSSAQVFDPHITLDKYIKQGVVRVEQAYLTIADDVHKRRSTQNTSVAPAERPQHL